MSCGISGRRASLTLQQVPRISRPHEPSTTSPSQVALMEAIYKTEKFSDHAPMTVEYEMTL